MILKDRLISMTLEFHRFGSVIRLWSDSGQRNTPLLPIWELLQEGVLRVMQMHSNLEAAVLTADGCVSRVSAPMLLAIGIQASRAAVWDHSTRKVEP